MFFWVFWYESNSGRKCLLRNYVYRLERLKLSYLHDWLYLLKVRAFTRQFTVRFGVGQVNGFVVLLLKYFKDLLFLVRLQRLEIGNQVFHQLLAINRLTFILGEIDLNQLNFANLAFLIDLDIKCFQVRVVSRSYRPCFSLLLRFAFRLWRLVRKIVFLLAFNVLNGQLSF